MKLSNCPDPKNTCSKLKQAIQRGFARILERGYKLGVAGLQITHKKTGRNRKEPATKKPVNTRSYRLLKLLTFVTAERAGFEPAIPFRVYTLSRRAPSTTRTPLQIKISRHTSREGRKNTQSTLTFRIIFEHWRS
jgi:hypothetical protein